MMQIAVKYHWKSQIALILLGTILNLIFMSGAKASEFSDKEGVEVVGIDECPECKKIITYLKETARLINNMALNKTRGR